MQIKTFSVTPFENYFRYVRSIGIIFHHLRFFGKIVRYMQVGITKKNMETAYHGNFFFL